MIHYVQGDLFSSKAQALAHGCNCAGVMGKGIALQFRQRYPKMFEAYRTECQANGFYLGEVMSWAVDGRMIFNLATQKRPYSQAQSWAIKDALTKTKTIMNNRNISSIALPHIGCGLGGLEWKEVRPIIAEVFIDWQGEVYIYSL